MFFKFYQFFIKSFHGMLHGFSLILTNYMHIKCSIHNIVWYIVLAESSRNIIFSLLLLRFGENFSCFTKFNKLAQIEEGGIV